MAYKIDKNGILMGDGLPDGVKINMDAYNSALSNYNRIKSTNGFYSSLPSPEVKLADSVSKFRYGQDGKIYAFIPELERPKTSAIVSMSGEKQPEWVERQPQGLGQILAKSNNFGQWVEASGIVFDESSKSGDAVGDFTLKMESGSPLAVFGNDKGYMRLATQQAKTADNLRLGNSSGTTSGSIRQNAQRRTLL